MQLIGATICAIWAFGATFVVFTVVNKVKSMRVSPEVELEGLDVPEFGLPGYPEDVSPALASVDVVSTELTGGGMVGAAQA
jgi:ammonia channel protein AmtB